MSTEIPKNVQIKCTKGIEEQDLNPLAKELAIAWAKHDPHRLSLLFGNSHSTSLTRFDENNVVVPGDPIEFQN